MNRRRRLPLVRKRIPLVRILPGQGPGRQRSFESDDQLLAGAQHLFAVRAWLAELGPEDEHLKDAETLERVWTHWWHQCFRRSGQTSAVAERCLRRRLNRLEREIVATLLLERLCLADLPCTDCQSVLAFLGRPGHETLNALRCLGENSRLLKAQLVFYEDRHEDIRDRSLFVDPALTEAVLDRSAEKQTGWPVKTEDEMYQRLGELTRLLRKKHDASLGGRFGGGSDGDVRKLGRRAERMVTGLNFTLTHHPGWGLCRLRQTRRWQRKEWIILLALVGKELRHVDGDDSLFTGRGLARAAANGDNDVAQCLQLLHSEQALIQMDFAQPTGGSGSLLSNDAGDIEETEYDLGPRAIEILGLEKRPIKKRSGRFQPREAVVALDQLVLAEPTRQALNLALTHARHGRTLMQDWGLGELIPYGRSVTLLFWGPPGTGKTATAEALAAELKKPILTANYAEIQNCFVGQTEKNIAAVFRAAAAHDAVLFWDEADAMFFDRDSASRNWEVRDVNVLLQELERFEGVCVLATNRRMTLDAALERRITLKMEFPKPGRPLREAIWRKLVPQSLPLAGDVDLAALAAFNLTGGEIKNAVLNAARRALERDGQGPVTQSDLLHAVHGEGEGKWTETGGPAIGFAAG